MKFVLIFLLFLTQISQIQTDVQCGENRFCRVGFKPFKSPNLPNEYQLLRNAAQKMVNYYQHKIVGALGTEAERLGLAPYIHELCQDDTVGFVLDENVSDYRISCIWTGASQFGQCRAVPERYMELPYYYVAGEEWSRKLWEVRNALGCNLFFNMDSVPMRKMRKSKTTSNTTTTAMTSSTSSTTPTTPRTPQNYSTPADSAHKRGNTTNYKTERGGRGEAKYGGPESELFICNERCVQGGIGYAASVLIVLTLAISFLKNCVELE